MRASFKGIWRSNKGFSSQPYTVPYMPSSQPVSAQEVPQQMWTARSSPHRKQQPWTSPSASISVSQGGGGAAEEHRCMSPLTGLQRPKPPAATGNATSYRSLTSPTRKTSHVPSPFCQVCHLRTTALATLTIRKWVLMMNSLHGDSYRGTPFLHFRKAALGNSSSGST